MSWLRLDDDMLDHPKWVRAIRDGGSAALHMWLALCSWCSRHLTDGEIPADIVPTLTQQWRARDRAKAIQALESSQLVAITEPGAIHIVDYLERNPSRAETLERRSRKADNQKNHAVRKKLTGQRPVVVVDDGPAPDPLPIPSRPDPVPTPEEGERNARAPGGSPSEVRTLQPSKRERAREAAAVALTRLRHKYPPDFEPTVDNRSRAVELGLTEAETWQRWDECRDKRYPAPFDDPVGQFNRELAWAKADKEKRMFKTQTEREAFEMPGRERRPA
jgi:hypothetical protein